LSLGIGLQEIEDENENEDEDEDDIKTNKERLLGRARYRLSTATTIIATINTVAPAILQARTGVP
jgi:hypothetical protein